MTKYYKSVLLLLFVTVSVAGCSLSGNECDKLAKVICKDERVQKLKRINGKGDSDPLILDDSILPGKHSLTYNYYTNMAQIKDECGRAKELARISREADTPLGRDEAVSACQTANSGLSVLLQMAPDR